MGPGSHRVRSSQLDPNHAEGGARHQHEGAITEGEGEGRAARVPERPNLGLLHVHLEVEEGTPIQIALDLGDEVVPFFGRQPHVVGVADGGHADPLRDRDPEALP